MNSRNKRKVSLLEGPEPEPAVPPGDPGCPPSPGHICAVTDRALSTVPNALHRILPQPGAVGGLGSVSCRETEAHSRCWLTQPISQGAGTEPGSLAPFHSDWAKQVPAWIHQCDLEARSHRHLRTGEPLPEKRQEDTRRQPLHCHPPRPAEAFLQEATLFPAWSHHRAHSSGGAQYATSSPQLPYGPKASVTVFPVVPSQAPETPRGLRVSDPLCVPRDCESLKGGATRCTNPGMSVASPCLGLPCSVHTPFLSAQAPAQEEHRPETDKAAGWLFWERLTPNPRWRQWERGAPLQGSSLQSKPQPKHRAPPLSPMGHGPFL